MSANNDEKHWSYVSALHAVVTFDRVELARAATRRETRWLALLLLVSAGVAAPFELDVGESSVNPDSSFSRTLQRIGLAQQFAGALARPALALTFACASSYVFGAFDKPMRTSWMFNLLGLAALWDILGWAISYVDLSVPVRALAWLGSLLTLLLGASELTQMRLHGALLAMCVAGIGSVCCAMCVVSTVVVVVLGVLVGLFGADAESSHEFVNTMKDFGVHVEM